MDKPTMAGNTSAAEAFTIVEHAIGHMSWRDGRADAILALKLLQEHMQLLSVNAKRYQTLRDDASADEFVRHIGAGMYGIYQGDSLDRMIDERLGDPLACD